jgi:hypothetical protein
LANLGYLISDQTVGNILHRHALPPAPDNDNPALVSFLTLLRERYPSSAA